MTARARASTVGDLEALILENGRMRVTVLPSAGGRVWQLTSLPEERDWLWNSPTVAPGAVGPDSVFDDCFSGGWDVLFPNDEPERLGGVDQPDHGELWFANWEVLEIAKGDVASITLRHEAPRSRCTVTRCISLAPGADELVVTESVTNHGADLPCLWKQHLALALEPTGTIEAPSARAELAAWGRPRAGRAGDVFDWPLLEGTRLDEVLPPGSPHEEFLYLTQLAEPWVGLRHPDGSRIRLTHVSNVVDSIWLFSSYGDWQGVRSVVLEPCTGTPLSVTEGVAAGTHRVLGAGEEWTGRFTVTIERPES